MIGWKTTPSTNVEQDAGNQMAQVRLGDVLRGERATLGKSLLDVQRDLRIKATYIAAIENADLSAFDAPSFAAGYVRSYARYLKIDADWAYERFCAETGYAPTHGLGSGAVARDRMNAFAGTDMRVGGLSSLGNGPMLGQHRSGGTTIDLRALGSVAVLVALVCGLGYGAYSVLQEVQRVHLAPIDQAPAVVAQLDPLENVAPVAPEKQAALDVLPATPVTDGLAGERMFRPEALDAPVLVSRDGPIAAIDPKSLGAVTPSFTDGGVQTAEAEGLPAGMGLSPVQVLGADAAEVEVIAVRPSWVRVQGADGAVIFEKVLNAGERFALPKLEEAPTLRTGESGAIYFAVNGQAYGPAGERGAVTKNIALSAEALTSTYQAADLAADADLAKFVNVADASATIAPPAQ